MTNPYPKRKILPKARTARIRLERLAVSEVSEETAKYFQAACQKMDKAITLLEKEAKE